MFLSYEGKDPLGKGKWKRTMFSLDGLDIHHIFSKAEVNSNKNNRKRLNSLSQFYLGMAIGANVLL